LWRVWGRLRVVRGAVVGPVGRSEASRRLPCGVGLAGRLSRLVARPVALPRSAGAL